MGLVIADDEMINTTVANGNRNVSNGAWHSVTLRRSGTSLQLLVNDQITFETTSAPKFLTVNSDLFIGGVPS